MKIKIGIAVIFIGILCGTVWLKPADAYSYEERRGLAQFPAVSAESISSGAFMEQFESYAADQFPLRRLFRGIQTVVSPTIDKNGLYEIEGYLAKMEYPLREESLAYASKVFDRIYTSDLQGKASNIYLSVIPDKNYFLAKESGALVMDYDRLVKSMKEKTAYMKYIDIFPSLSKECYYKTDVHWRQETLLPVADILLTGMGKQEVIQQNETERNLLAEDFKGVYAGQWAAPVEEEELSCLTNDTIEDMVVYDWENNREIPV